MRILAIETSCDDTAVAILEIIGKKNTFFRILANVVSSQEKIHKKHGGIVPNLASRAHAQNINFVFEKAIKNAFGRKKGASSKVDLVAATNGPGLLPSLLIGVNFAKALAYAWGKPLIGINHIEGHIYSNFIKARAIKFPAICLIVSGGHTQLILIKKHGDYALLGETRDDAAGEAFDKVARLLGLGYPGGPAIAKAAEKGNADAILLPRPMIKTKDYDFSFSGLKTAVLYLVQDKGRQARKKSFIQNAAASFQESVVDVLTVKTIRAAKECGAKSILLGGGVAANKRLRRELSKGARKIKVPFFVPQGTYCTDNALMIAAAAYYAYKKEKNYSWRSIKTDPNLRLVE